MKKYYQAWILRRKGLTLKKIGLEMSISSEWSRTMINFIEFKVSNKNIRKVSNELKKICEKTNFYI